MKKKILFIIWSYTFGGGAESLLTSIVNHLNPEKYEISVIEYHHEGIKKEATNKNIHVLPFIESKRKIKRRIQTLSLHYYPKILIKDYIDKGFDLYVAFNYLIPTFLLPPNTINIAWIHGDVYDLLDRKKVNYRKRQDKAFYNINRIIAISDNTEKSLIEVFPEHQRKINKIYNGVDIKKIKMKSIEKSTVQLKHPSILFIGRLENGKNPQRLLRVFKLLHERHVYAHLYFLGDGVQKKSIIDQSKIFGLSGFIHMLGYHQNPFPIIKQCDLVCLLSRSEGFSMCLLESVALGKPFVSTNIGGAWELSNEQKCGSIIETDEQAVDAISFWLKSDERKVFEECQKSIKRFELNHYISQIEDLFDSVINEKEARS